MINSKLHAGSGQEESGSREPENHGSNASADVKLRPASSDGKAVVVIDRRILLRDCMVHRIRSVLSDVAVLGYNTSADWLSAASSGPAASVVLLCGYGQAVSVQAISRDIALLRETEPHTPVILVSDEEDGDNVARALDSGVQGYIPTSATLEIALGAVGLVQAGGVFVPASAVRKSCQSNGAKHAGGEDTLTERENAVLAVLQLGKSNKLIAADLNMCANTVKVHVRHIMKKLKAKSRTEVAYLANTGRIASRQALDTSAALEGARIDPTAPDATLVSPNAMGAVGRRRIVPVRDS